jgi:hypothetical protein
MAVKTCVFCDAPINPRMIVCPKHVKDYEMHKGTEYLNFLIADHQREYRETIIEDTLVEEGDAELPEPKTKISYDELKKIFELRDKYGWGARKISRELGLKEFAVRYHLSSDASKRSSHSGIREKRADAKKSADD